ncbi:MAG: PhnD/SsuA/transferrin family substrate-binding protein [Amaricoccus sp.]
MTGVAALPMYDWPEVAGATDRLWAAIRDALRAAGVAAPDALDRAVGLMAGWTHPELVLGQACGLPFVRALAGRVTLLGAIDYGLPGCPPGWYRSAVVVRRDDPRDTLEAFREARLAVNGFDSQSGWGSILHHAAPLGGGFFGEVVVSGAHRASVAMVADGAADIAAIDWVSWRLARRFLPEAGRLRVLLATEPTPGQALIAAAGIDAARHAAAVAAGIGGLDAAAKAELGLVGFAPLVAGDYRVIGERLTRAEALAERLCAPESFSPRAEARGAPARLCARQPTPPSPPPKLGRGGTCPIGGREAEKKMGRGHSRRRRR